MAEGNVLLEIGGRSILEFRNLLNRASRGELSGNMEVFNNMCKNYSSFVGVYWWGRDNSLRRLSDVESIAEFERKNSRQTDITKFPGKLVLPETWEEFSRISLPPYDENSCWAYIEVNSSKRGGLCKHMVPGRINRDVEDLTKYDIRGINLMFHPAEYSIKKKVDVPTVRGPAGVHA